MSGTLSAAVVPRPEWDQLAGILGGAQGGAWRLGTTFPCGVATALDSLGDRAALVAVRMGDRPVAVGVRAVKPVLRAGSPARLGYLALLRRDPGLSPWAVPAALGAAFATLARLRADDELPFDLTAILRGNRAARRLLTAGLPGVPAYRPVDVYTVRCWRRSALAGTIPRAPVRPATAADLPQIAILSARDGLDLTGAVAGHDGLWLWEDDEGLLACGRILDPRRRRPLRLVAAPSWYRSGFSAIAAWRWCRGQPVPPRPGATFDLVHLGDWHWRPGAVAAAAGLARFLAGTTDAATVAAGWSDRHPDAAALDRLLGGHDRVGADWYTVGEYADPGRAWHLDAGGL